MEKKKNENLLWVIIALIAVVIIGVAMFLVYINFKPKAKEGSKEIVVQVIVPDVSDQEFTIVTDAEYLREALEEEELIKGTEAEYGLMVEEVNGFVADSTNEEWWCITQDGGTVNYGVDTIAISDGDHYELTLTSGY